MVEGAVVRRMIEPYGALYDGAVDLGALRAAHQPLYRERTSLTVDGNVAAAIPFLQWWRAIISAGFPITPATKWLEHLAAEISSGHFVREIGGRKVSSKRVKQLESEHAAADYLVGVGSACRSLIVGTATSSVGLDHMTETTRSLGASGLGNVMVVNVCRCTANYPLCIEGDPSDTLAHRDDGFIQVMCRGKQQIYDTLLQLPAVGMHPEVLTPTMPAYFGIKDSHRNGKLLVEPDDAVNRFLDEALALEEGGEAPVSQDFLDLEGRLHWPTPPGLLDGDTSMGNCVTSAWFQGFKTGQKARQQRALDVIPRVEKLFKRHFGRTGIELFEQHGMKGAEIAIVCLGPDAGTLIDLLPRLSADLKIRVGALVLRVITPFPRGELAKALEGVRAIGVVNQAHHHGRGHLTLDVSDALATEGRRVPIEAFFCGLGGGDVSIETWKRIVETTRDAAARGGISRPWHILSDGVEMSQEPT